MEEGVFRGSKISSSDEERVKGSRNSSSDGANYSRAVATVEKLVELTILKEMVLAKTVVSVEEIVEL